MSKSKDRAKYFKIRQWFGVGKLPEIKKDIDNSCPCCGNIRKKCNTVEQANKCDKNKF